MAAVRHLGFLKARNFNCWSGSDGRYALSNQMLCQSVKLLPRYRNYYFLGCRPPPSWISLNFKFLTDQTVTRAELRHPVKFRWNCRNCGRDMAGYEFESLQYGDFSIFQDGGRRHLEFSKFQIFNGRNGQEGQTASACQISSKSVKPRPTYGYFSIFRNGGCRHLGFRTKFQIFTCLNGQEGRTASPSQIS